MKEDGIIINMISKEIKKYMSDLGKKSAKSLTKEQRSERARNAVKTRWAKRVDNSIDK